MRISRSLFRPESVSAALLCLGLIAGQTALAQTETKSAPSPVAPGDLSKPVFDTKTPVYDSIERLGKAASTVVAEVEGRAITMGDVGDAIRALPPAVANLPLNTLYPNVLEQLIRQEALVVRAQQQGVDEEPTIRRKVRAAADRQLAEEYLHEEIFKGITEAELLDRYNVDIAGRPGPEEVWVRVILTRTEKEAQDLIAEIHGGADFAAVARRASKDPTAPNGGDLGFTTREGLNPEVGAVAFSLPTGQVAPYPVRCAAGWFVVKVEERRPSPTPSFVSAREQLTQTLLREGMVPFATATLKGLKVRKYDMVGDEMGVDKPEPR